MENRENHQNKRSQDSLLTPISSTTEPPAPVPCQYCGKLRYTKLFKISDIEIWDPVGPAPCDCPEAQADCQKQLEIEQAALEAKIKAQQEQDMRDRVQRIIKSSGMNARFLHRTFDNFEQTNDNRKALRFAKAYADKFETLRPRQGETPGRNGLFLTGPKGIGKTHLAAAIANQVMNSGTAVICMTMIDLLDEIRKTFDPGIQTASSAVLAVYKDVPLLIIDDLGKEPPTEWAIATIYNIINGRYEAFMPTIVTTNYDDAQLVKRLTPPRGDEVTADATIDRLREMCVGVMMSGTSWRSR